LTRAVARKQSRGPDLFSSDLPRVHVGETWAKRLKDGTRLYLVLDADESGRVRLQNIDTPSSVFETAADKIIASGYYLVSQQPFVDLGRHKRGQTSLKPRRCPRTVDFLEGRPDCEPPARKPAAGD
jgi:hypothetical protein